MRRGGLTSHPPHFATSSNPGPFGHHGQRTENNRLQREVSDVGTLVKSAAATPETHQSRGLRDV